jgi:PKHD-type hydroxylase
MAQSTIDNVNNWAWAQIFSPEECKKIIDIGNRAVLSPATFDELGKADVDKKVRDSDISWLFPSPETDWIFEKISNVTSYLNKNFFNFHLSSFAEGLQFTRYVAPTGHYERHTDKAFEGPIRKLSLTIQLSDSNDYEGGELMLYYGETQSMPKEQGKAIAFPSYVLHQVTPVTVGTRYSLVAWVAGNQFT